MQVEFFRSLPAMTEVSKMRAVQREGGRGREGQQPVVEARVSGKPCSIEGVVKSEQPGVPRGALLSVVEPGRPNRGYAMVRKSGGAKKPRRRSGSGPSCSHATRRRGMVAAERTRHKLFGAPGMAAAQPGGACPDLEASSSTTPAARADSVASRPRGGGTSDHTRPLLVASASHCLAVSASKRRSAWTRSLRSTLRLP